MRDGEELELVVMEWIACSVCCAIPRSMSLDVARASPRRACEIEKVSRVDS